MTKAYRKKPVVIEARQLSPDNHGHISNWIASAGYNVKHASCPPMRAVTGIVIETLEGDMRADYGDWIIKGVQGEFYPCKPDIFAATYEAVDGPEATDGRVIAGRTLEQWREFARRDDALDCMVPSDLRQLISAIGMERA